jgi:membrane-associated phospholipid phosphatase
MDPNRPESASLALLAACLLAIGWAWFALLAMVLARGGPLALDWSVYSAMSSLRNPLADRLMAGLASLGDLPVLLPACALAMTWLLWRRRWMAAAHWLAALAFGLVLTSMLDAWFDMPAPPSALHGFGFPSIAVTMTTIAFGFFAVLVARELPGRRRVWPYLVGGAVVTTIGFARLYLGAHWLSDVVGGALLGIVWLLLLGLAYRSHVARSFWMRPLAIAFYGGFLVAAAWHLPRAVDPLLAQYAQHAAPATLDRDAWWNGDAWRALPAHRNEREASLRWPLDVQVAGPLPALRARLAGAGWREQPEADWVSVLGLLDDDRPPARQAVLPATLDTEAESLLLRRSLPGGDIQVLRLWAAPVALRDGTPVWLGTTQVMRYDRLFDVFGLWRPLDDHGRAHADLHHALRGPGVRDGERNGRVVLRVDTRGL